MDKPIKVQILSKKIVIQNNKQIKINGFCIVVHAEKKKQIDVSCFFVLQGKICTDY